jgi:alanyl-tRNA synthetase
MFTNAGMVQFKDVFAGKETRAYRRAASAQKCIRISGKHNDLENVGRTSRHHTFFEMLGNFSFGDYFKAEACRFAWDLMRQGFDLDPAHLWCSVHHSDDEAFAIWRDEIGVPEERIFRLGDKDNFWAMGDTGPCGPCSEILYDRGDAFGEASPENGERFFEIWNLVFMQYLVDEPGGPRRPLPRPSIDTGAGLERIVSVLQGVSSNFDTDLFVPLINLASEIAGRPYGADQDDDVSLRVIADHARMTAFLMAEGVLPDRKERAYVLRRVMRRAIRHGHRLGIEQPFLHRVALAVVELMASDYPELAHHRELIERATVQEEKLFRQTLARGMRKLGDNRSWLERDGQRLLPGEVAYDLYQQDGFPKDLIEVIGLEQGFTVDETGWLEAENRHKEASRGDDSFAATIDPLYFELSDHHGPTEFVGYDREEARSDVLALIRASDGPGDDGSQPAFSGKRNSVTTVSEGDEVEVLLAVTPCYGESGGQVGDQGLLSGPTGEVAITDTQQVRGLLLHRGTVSRGTIEVGQNVLVEVDHGRRQAIRRNHSATHLVHWALRSVLGTHATQRGSVVSPEGLRFDFSHGDGLKDTEIQAIEDLANLKVWDNVAVQTEVTSPDDAQRRGAMALFGEKYGDAVRLVTVSSDSLELCGGTHVSQTGEIGLVKVTRQESVGAGVRRLYAVTGDGALAHVRRLEHQIDQIGHVVREADRDLVAARVEKLDQDKRRAAKEVEELKRTLAQGGGDDLLAGAREIAGVKALAKRLPVGDGKAMMQAADAVRDRLGSGVALLGADNQGKAALIVVVTKDLTSRLDAVKLIRQVAPAVGARGGGGRPDLARTGGPSVDGLDEALEQFYQVVAQVLADE